MALASAERERKREEQLLQADTLYYIRRLSISLSGAEKDYPPSYVMELGRQHAENKRRAALQK